MLRVVTGPFHPYLESALVDHLRAAKAADPFASLALVVPSSSLADHVRRLLAQTHGLSLLNFHLLTFHQLALRLAEEASLHPSSPMRMTLVDTLFCEQLVRQVLRRGSTSLREFDHLPHASGTWGALWATIRDLKDGAVDADVALHGLDEGYFDEDDHAWLGSLLSLHAAITAICETLTVGTADDLAASLRDVVPQSAFLKSLQHLVYYGFYDLTQVQLSLFEAAANRAPTTLFFPLEAGPAGAFAGRFFERHIVPLANSPGAIVPCLEDPDDTSVRRGRPLVTVRSVVGADEELASVCRHILDLVETYGYRFVDIGVVGRTLDPYCPLLASVFDRHRIPFRTTCGRPLIQEPLAKLVLQLATVPLSDAYRNTVLDLVTAPLYRSDRHARAPEHVRPDLWKLIVPTLSITRGRDEWSRLDRTATYSWPIGGTGEEDTSDASVAVAPGVTRMLSEIVSELLDECDAIPVVGAPGELAAALRRLVVRHFALPIPEAEDGNLPMQTDALVWESLEAVFSSVGELDRMGERIAWGEFVDVLTHAMERATIPITTSNHGGIEVLDAMEARGRSFRALFIVGMNEQVFPRYVREDPFLRDRHRRVLATTLGFKVDEKLSAYDEEALLFALLCRSATDQLILSFQRADGQGRPLGESSYVGGVEQTFESGPPPRDIVPRRLSERVAMESGQRTLFTREELALWLTLRGHDPVPLLDAAGRAGELYRAGAEALDQIEAVGPRLSGFDGVVGPLPPVEGRVHAAGLAPTALERYGRCPFQYFCADVLDLEPIVSARTHDLDPRVLGTLCHAALRDAYAELIAFGWPHTDLPDARVSDIVRGSVDRAAAASESRGYVGPYLLWQLALEQIRSVCKQAIESDRAGFEEDGFSPVAFELTATGDLRLKQDEGHDSIAIHGRVDRLDQHRESGSIRVVDYKFKLGASMKSDDRQLAQAALRGVRLQPPLYARFHFEGYPPPAEVQFVFLAPSWTPPIARSRFDAATWSGSIGDRLNRTLHVLIDGIRQGRYFMLPDTYCGHCGYRAACRREHASSWWRVFGSAEAEVLRGLRRECVDDK